MEAKTLNPHADTGPRADGDGAPRTLAAGEIVWAKPKGRRVWWPARLLVACPADAARDAAVSYCGDPGAPPGPAAQVRRFADPDADRLAQGSVARAFLEAVEEAHASAVATLRASLTCGCVRPPSPPPEAGGVGIVLGHVANLSPVEFLAALRDAALPDSPVGLVDRARLKSWVLAFGEGWGPDGAGRYRQRSLEELVDKIDLDVSPGEDKEDDEWLADAEDNHKASEGPQETRSLNNKRGFAARMDELDAGEDSGTGTGTSGKRERKRSKYLSPPYTYMGVLSRKATGFSKALALTASAAESVCQVLGGSLSVEEVWSLVLGLAKDISNGSHFPKATETFFRSFRSTEFKCPEIKFLEGHESPETHAVAKVDVDVPAGVVSDSQTPLKLSKCAAKRSMKKDDDGRASSSIKKKKREKYSPAATVGCDLPIPAIPIRQVKAIRSQMKEGDDTKFLGVVVKDEEFKPSMFKCEISPVIHETTEPVQELVTLPDQPAKENDEAKLKDEKNEPSLFKCILPAFVLGGAESGQEQQVDGFAKKTSLTVNNTFSEQYAKKNDKANFEDEKSEPIALKCPISAAVPGATTPEEKQAHQNVVSAVTTPQAADNTLSDQSAEENGEAMVGVTKSETNVESMLVDVPIRSVEIEATGSKAKVCTDENVQSVVTDFLVTHLSREAAESKANVCFDETVQSVGADDVPVQSVGADDVPVQSVGANDVPVQSVGATDVPMQSSGADVRVSNEPPTVDGGITQAVDENEEHSRVEIHTVEQSYASLQTMGPEMLTEVANNNGTYVNPVNNALNNECHQDASMVNIFSDKAANGTGPDATTSTPKKKKKKTTQLFMDPAEVIVEFAPGVIMPSREELLSAFGKFGFVIESQTNITKVTRSARVVFGKKAEAENAYKRAEYLGEFGPPFATLKLGVLPPIELSAPSRPHSLPSSSRPPLADIRKNLEKMILARHTSLKNETSADGLNPDSNKLLADMQGLLAQVDKMLDGPSS